MDWKFEAVSDAFEAASFAASLALELVDSNLRAVRAGNCLVDCLMTARETDNDMMEINLCAPRDEKEKQRSHDAREGGGRAIESRRGWS